MTLKKSTPIITQEEISTSQVSETYKTSILNAYEYAQKDEKGYFFDPACRVFRYILGLTDEIPTDRNHGIKLSELVDDAAPWTDIDTRIVQVIIRRLEPDEDEYPELFKLSSWLFSRLKNVNNDDFATHIYPVLQKRELVSSEKEMILSLVLGYPVILIRNKQTTSFGKIALNYIDDMLELMKEEEKSEAIYQIYLLLQKEEPVQFKHQFESLLEDMLQSGDDGRYYAIMATEQEYPERALAYAKEESINKYISTTYRVCFYAKGDARDKYKKILFDLYQEHGINTDRSKRVLQIWGEEEGQIILEKLGAKSE